MSGKNASAKGSLGRRGRYLHSGDDKWEEQKEPSETAFISRVSLRILNALLNHWFLTAICHRERIITFRYKAKFTKGLEYRGWFVKSDYSHLLFVSERPKINDSLNDLHLQPEINSLVNSYHHGLGVRAYDLETTVLKWKAQV